MFKIGHTADMHVRDGDIEEIENNVMFMSDKFRKENVDIIVFAGDAADSKNLKMDSLSGKLIIKLFSVMCDIAPVIFCLGTDSHDGLIPEILEYVKGKYPIRVSTRPEQILMINNTFYDVDDFDNQPYCDERILITTCPPPSKKWIQTSSGIDQSNKDIGQAMSSVFAGFGEIAKEYDCPHIFTGHFQTIGARISDTQELVGVDIEIGIDQIELCNPDIICLGHIHKVQNYYPGSIYRKNFGELDDKGFFIHTIGNEIPDPIDFEYSYSCSCSSSYIVSTDFINVPAVNRYVLKYDFRPFEGLDFNSFFDADVFKGQYKIKLEITLWQDQVKMISKSGISKIFHKVGAISCDIKLDVIPREIVRSSEIQKAKTLPDKIKALSDSRGEILAPGITDRVVELEKGLDSDQLIKLFNRGK